MSQFPCISFPDKVASRASFVLFKCCTFDANTINFFRVKSHKNHVETHNFEVKSDTREKSNLRDLLCKVTTNLLG